MVYTPAARAGHGLTAEQLLQLEELERVTRPTPFARGRLDALRLCADMAELVRVEAIAAKWGPSDAQRERAARVQEWGSR
jgi:hypothetical protein